MKVKPIFLWASLLLGVLIATKPIWYCEARVAARTMHQQNKLKQCGVTDAVFADDIVDSDGVPILSWRVLCANEIKDKYGEWNPPRPIVCRSHGTTTTT